MKRPPISSPATQKTRRQSGRRGLTILEVIISIGIFLASATVVSQLLGTGTRAALAGRRRSQMTLLAETKMSEIAAGIREMTSADGQNFEQDDPGSEDYTWSVTVEDGGMGDLMLVTVTVEHTKGAGDVDDAFKLARLMRDPQVWIDAAEAASEAEEEEDGSVL